MILRPMLATNASPNRLLKLCRDERYFCEPKVDGHRLVIHAGGGDFYPSSRTGRRHDVSAELMACFKPFIDSEVIWIFDGEWLDQQFWLFDLPEVGDIVTTTMPYEDRRAALERFVGDWSPAECVKLLPVARTTDEKLAMAERIIEQHGEGLMFKLRNGVYSEGKRTDAQLKVKFVKDVDCVVTGTRRGGKDNIVLSMVRDGVLVEVAECTALAGDKDKIKVGDVVKVQCLYATKDDRLYQPTRPLIRDDKLPEDCLFSQLDEIRTNKSVIV